MYNQEYADDRRAFKWLSRFGAVQAPIEITRASPTAVRRAA
jgi:hypothetical protein